MLAAPTAQSLASYEIELALLLGSIISYRDQILASTKSEQRKSHFQTMLEWQKDG
jgi:hypothetical protein